MCRPIWPALCSKRRRAIPTRMVVSNFFPDSMGPQIKKAADAGIPVIIMDGGFATWRDVGGLTYVGYDPHALGVKAGEIEAKAGVKHGLCVNHVPGNPALESMCTGLWRGDEGGRQRRQDADHSRAGHAEPTGQFCRRSRARCRPTRRSTASSRWAPTQTDLSVRAAQETGREGKIKIGGVALSTKVLEEVRDGKALFDVDLQGYLDGYYSLLIAYQKAKFDMSPAEPVFAGPHFMFKNDAQRIIDLNKEFPGYRGTE